jgi:hypothetical protein
MAKDKKKRKKKKKVQVSKQVFPVQKSNREVFIDLLRVTKRKGHAALIDYLCAGGFFTAPASRKNHAAYKGGLAEHSLNVLELVTQYNKIFMLGIAREPGQDPLRLTGENIIIGCLLHDLCKIDRYTGDEGSYKLNPDSLKGHGLLSIHLASKFIELEPIELMMIKYHMGVYHLKEFDKKGEYRLRGKGMAHAWYHNPIVKLMYICDEMAVMQEKRAAEVTAAELAEEKEAEEIAIAAEAATRKGK